jgi:hypothetical protein
MLDFLESNSGETAKRCCDVDRLPLDRQFVSNIVMEVR